MGRGHGPIARQVHGPDALAVLAPVYDTLAGHGDAPVTARWAWLATWADTHPSWQPLAVVVEDGQRGIVGAALLMHRRRGPLVDIAALGHGQSDYARFPARDPEAGARLAEATAAAVRDLGVLRRLRLDGFPRADPVLDQLAARLPGTSVVAGEGAPVVRLAAGVDPASSGRREARTMARRGRNRLATDGHVPTLDVVTDPGRVAALMPELEQLHRARDHSVRGRSDIDDPEDHAFWRAICADAAGQGLLEVSTLRVDDELAAYVVAFLDGSTYRVWDPRISPAHARYNPGHVLRADVLARVAADGRFDALDWMRGEERYKLSTTSEVVALDRVLAWSPPLLAVLEPRLRQLWTRVRSARAVVSRAAAPPPRGPEPRSASCAAVVERALDAPALVIGTPPPQGRDLDLIVHSGQLEPLARVLEAAGFVPSPAGWLRWARTGGRLRAEVVEIDTADSWALPDAEQRWLWTHSRPLPGHPRLHRPSPAAAVLLTARRFAATLGDPRTSWIAKTARPADEAAAWTQAAAHASAWGARHGLDALADAVSAGRRPAAATRYRLALETVRSRDHAHLRALRRALLPRRRSGGRRSGVVALSGLDGAGKSSQADLLATALADLGVPTTTAWTRLSYRDWLHRLDRLIAVGVRLVRAVRRGRGARDESYPADVPADAPGRAAAERPVRAFRQRHPSLTWCWAWVVALDAVADQRRTIRRARGHHAVVVCDRYALDSAAHLHVLYGDTVSTAAQAWAVRVLSPRPIAAFLLRIEAAEAFRRKPEEFTVEALARHARSYDVEAALDPVVTVLDGTREPLELGETIARAVLAVLER